MSTHQRKEFYARPDDGLAESPLSNEFPLPITIDGSVYHVWLHKENSHTGAGSLVNSKHAIHLMKHPDRIVMYQALAHEIAHIKMLRLLNVTYYLTKSFRAMSELCAMVSAEVTVVIEQIKEDFNEWIS